MPKILILQTCKTTLENQETRIEGAVLYGSLEPYIKYVRLIK